MTQAMGRGYRRDGLTLKKGSVSQEEGFHPKGKVSQKAGFTEGGSHRRQYLTENKALPEGRVSQRQGLYRSKGFSQEHRWRSAQTSNLREGKVSKC